MSDTSQFVAEDRPVLSQFDTSIDVERIDRNVQQISAVESTWQLPQLPDEVKADLATLPDVDETGLFAFLTGLDDEIRRAAEGEQEQDAAIETARADLDPLRNTGIDQARIVVAALSGNPAPEAVTADAVKRFKLDAIDAGLLDMDPRRVDSSWSPELNGIRNDLQFARYDERLRGGREGAMELEGVNKLLYEFTSPAGLVSAATQLDLWWDTGAIGREYSTWGDKWRKLGESKNPVEWAGNLFDALTGPLDDIILPALNIGLMFTGFGAAFNTGRIGMLVARGKNLDAITDLYRTSRLAKLTGGTRAVRNFEELGRPGLLGGRLARANNALARRTGELMNGWRGALPVRTTKGLLQPVMRAGVASQIESRMGSFAGGVSLADVSDPIDELSERMYLAGLSPVTVLPEVMLAPYNIFTPGTFIGRGGQTISRLQIASRAGRGARRAIGSAPGRAAVGAVGGAAVGTATGEDVGDIGERAAVGAGALALAPRVGRLLMRDSVPGAIKSAAAGAGAGALLGDDPEDIAFGAGAGVGFFGMSPTVRRQMTERLPSVTKGIRGIGRGLDLMSFRPVADRQEPALAIHMGMVSHLENTVTIAASAEERAAAQGRLNRWNTNVRTSGVRRALAEEMELGTSEVAEETAAASMVWANTLLSIDHIAHTQAKALNKKIGWRSRWAAARNKLANQIRPFDLDQPSEALYDDLSMALAWTEVGARQLTDGTLSMSVRREDVLSRAEQIRRKLVENPDYARRMVEDHRKKAKETLHQLWNPGNFPKADANVPFGQGNVAAPPIPSGTEDLVGLSAFGRARLMADYMPQIWDRFGNWPKFTAATDEVRRARLTGLLDPADLVVAKTRTGRPSNITNVRRRQRGRPIEEANEAFTDVVLDPQVGDRLNDAAVTPFAPSVLPGRVTVENLTTKTGQELFELRERVDDLVQAKKHLERLDRRGWEQILEAEEVTTRIGELTKSEVAHLVKQLPAGGTEDSFRYIVGFAKRKGFTYDDFAVGVLGDEAAKLADNSALWDEFGLPASVADDNGRTLFGFEALEKRAADLQDRWQWAGKEVDMEGLARKYREAGRHADAMRVERLDAALKGDDYRLVHGVEFVMPEDLAMTPKGIWADINRKHMNYATLGNFFRGRLPVEGHLVADLRHRAALVSELSQLKDSPLNKAGAKSEEVDGIIDFLRTWLRDEQNEVEHLTRHMDLGSVTRRTGQRLVTSMTPVNIEDIQARGKEIRQALRAVGYTDDEARAITRATAKFRNSTFRDMGVYSLEAKFRSQNQVAASLKAFAGSKYADQLAKQGKGSVRQALGRGRAHRFVGGFTGAAAGRSQFDDDDTFEQKLGKVAIGGLTGMAAGTVSPHVARGLGRAAVETVGTFAPDAARTLAGQGRDWRYGYMADTYARIRDSLRFTLSPIFDASRYTEGLLLGQTGAPMRYGRDVKDAAGKVIHKAGDRVILPLNLTPRALKRQLSKAHGTDEGRRIYNERVGQFQKFARDAQDFNPEILDSTGRWFKQVGILGFSPVDWMGTAFARLLDEGFEADEAYDAARRMYTYATGKGIGRTRSPAELSVNFVMFPFSFQKKALGHLAKWMNDDLGRSIIIHDAMKTYELLDEEYDLESRWRDYMPWMNQLKRLNLFAYGLSAGRFGGINSQLFETGGKVAWNMFVPAGMNIQADNAEEAQALARDLFPVWNDINWMIRNYHETANQFSNPDFKTRSAERQDGWNEWNNFKRDFDTELRNRGYTLEDLRKPWLAEAQAYYEDKRTELAERYPAWWESREEAIGNNVMEEQARNLAIDRHNRDVRLGLQPKVDDFMIARFEEMMAQVKERMRLTMGIDSLEDAPPEVTDEIIRLSVENARQNPRWPAIWDTYYANSFGPITAERRL